MPSVLRVLLTIYTARNAQVAASLLQACCLAVIKLISGCVRIACSGLMITSLLQVVNRLDASWLSRLFIHKFDASCFNNLQQVCKNINLQQVWFSQICCNLMNSTDLLQLVDNLQQAGKIHNLQQVCVVSGCVVIDLWLLFCSGWQKWLLLVGQSKLTIRMQSIWKKWTHFGWKIKEGDMLRTCFQNILVYL